MHPIDPMCPVRQSANANAANEKKRRKREGGREKKGDEMAKF